MPGTIPISLQQQFSSSTSRLLSGGKVYFFQSGTLNPQNAYRESALANAYANPYTLLSDGRVPYLWFADGSIRVRLTDSGGVVQFDQDMEVLGASSEGGGGVDTTDPNSIASTGDIKFRLQSGSLTGWVRLNGRTIGSASSGATERANADVADLFEYLWTNFSNTICPVSGGRGASAAADFAANKTITVPDARGRTIFGLDDMGNSAASRITSATFLTPTTAGTTGGAETHTLETSQIPSHTHVANVTDPGHVHTTTPSDLHAASPTAAVQASGANFNFNAATNVTVNSATTGITVTNVNAGGGGAHNNMPPGILGTWFMRI